MYLVNTIEQYNSNNLFFCEPIKNNIMTEGKFIRILYSNDHITLNGVYILIDLYDILCEKYYNKYKCIFNIINHKEIIDSLKLIEEEILKKYETNKMPSYKIYEQIKTGYIKIFSDITNNKNYSFILKISGIWETQNNYGLTYKFIKINKNNKINKMF
jgi:hypothetical protein